MIAGVESNDAISFVVGLIIGALGTISLFRGSLAVLQTQVTQLTANIGSLASKQEKIERDINGLAEKLREEFREAITEIRK